MRVSHAAAVIVLASFAAATAGSSLAAQSAPARALAQPVRTKAGLVQGILTGDASLAVFRGVPFAAPPTGQLRWQPPAPAPSWQGVRLADRFAASCVQNIVHERKPWTYEFMAHGEVSEDCLYLNVWTGAKSATERRPVLMWIHGGGNNDGSGAIHVYDGEGLARKGLVVVTVNYRLNTFGFFSHPELTKESAHGASGNYGVIDLVAALQWIRDNISAFGGDPSRVTVAGQSAGSTNAQILMASPLAKGLFHRVIAESGAAIDAVPARPRAEVEAIGVRFATAKGANTLAELRAMPWQTIAAALPPPPAGTAPLRFGPVVDGYALPRSVADAMAQGQTHDVPVLTGSNADEGGAVPQPTVTLAEFQSQAKQRYGDSAQAFLSLYPAATDDEAKAAQNISARDRSRTATYLWAANRARHARSATYTYFWTHPLPGPDAARYGAFHTSEVPYALNSIARSDRPFTDVDRRVADTMSSYWANFATAGDPNGANLPRWPSTRERPWTTQQIGGETKSIPSVSSDARREFLERVFADLVGPGPAASAR